MNRVTIDVEARFVDHVTGETAAASRAVEGIGKSADKAQKQLDVLSRRKVKPIFDADTNKLLNKIKAAESRAAKLGRTKTTMVLKAMDHATSTIGKVLNKAQSFANKTWTSYLKIKDSDALASLKQIQTMAKGFAGKTWTTMVRIKDFATAPLTKIKNTLFSIKTLVAAITAGFAANKLFMEPISLADAYTGTKIGFSTLLGDEEGQAMMDAMDDFAKKTPFKTSGVISNAQKMMAYGWDPTRILSDMETIGNAAAATGKMDEGLSSIVYALSEIRSKGKLSTQELNQLASAGIKAKAYLAQGLGYGTSDEGLMKLAEDLEKGAIGANQAIELILEGMKEFDGMMDRTANETVSGLKAQIADVFEISIFRKWGMGLQDGAKRGMGYIVQLLDSAEEGLNNLGDMLYEVGKKDANWAADRLERAVEMATNLAETEEFKNAGLWGKVKILWDGIVANPIKEWWEGGGREKTAQTAGKIGSWLGKTLSNGLLAILGASDILEGNGKTAEDAGSSIAGSFVKGFLDNFDGAAITEALADAISNVWNFLPWWAKMLVVGKGVSMVGNVVGGAANLIGGARNLIGSTGNATVNGSGLLGGLASLGYGMTGGGGAGKWFGAGMKGGTAALLGLGKVVGYGGLAVGATTAISGGKELYTGYKEDDQVAWQSGGAKTVGALGGAAVGATIGSFIPGVGTVIGAGIGALAGSAWGLWESNKIKEEAAKNAEDLEALAQSESAAAEEAAKLLAEQKKLAAASLDEHFGDLVLSAEELEIALKDIIGASFFKEVETATAAIEAMDASFTSVTANSANLKKATWLAYQTSNGRKLTDDEKATLKGTAENFSAASKSYIQDAQYAAEESIIAIMGNTEDAQKLIDSNTDYYKSQSDELTSLANQYNEKLSAALSDNVISLDEKRSLDTIRSQMAEITRKLQEEEYEAEMNILQAKYGGDLNYDSFGSLMAGMTDQNIALSESYWQEYGRASVGKSEAEKKVLLEATLDKQTELWKKQADYGIGTIREEYANELNILGQDLPEMFKNNTTDAIMEAVAGLDEPTRSAIGTYMELMEPTTAQVEQLVQSYKDAGMEIPEALTSYLATAEFYEALSKGPEAVEKYFEETKIDLEPKLGTIDLSNVTEWEGNVPVNKLNKVFNVEANVNTAWTYDEFDEEWISPDGNYSFTTEGLVLAGWTYNEFEKKWISPDGKYSFKTEADVNVSYSNNKFSGSKNTFGIQDNYSASTNVSVTANYSVIGGGLMMSKLLNDKYAGDNYRGGIVGGDSAMEAFARGGRPADGMLKGTTRFISVNEEAPEMIIPLSKQRRDRAMKLWEKTGRLLGVPGFAKGGMTAGGSNESIRDRQYGGAESSGTEQTVQVDIGGITMEINVNVEKGENITEAIKAQAAEIAETVAGIMADALSAQFENTPVRGGIA